MAGAEPVCIHSDIETDEVDAVFARARVAQADWESRADQAMLDRAALAAAWALMEPGRNQELSELAVKTTGLGNGADKIRKNHRKTLGLLRDIQGVKTCGIVAEKPELGLTEIVRPIGVIGAVVPSTNPVATPANNIINALKCGNAIILSPSPKGVEACERLLEYIHAEFDKAGIPRDLVQMVPRPSTKAKTNRLMQLADLLVVTGSQANVRNAYSSGTPAVGVGTGNVAVIVDETASLKDAAIKITVSKTFDNATSCSSENSVIVVDAVFDEFVAALEAEGGMLLDPAERDQLLNTLWQDGKLNRATLARDIDALLTEARLTRLNPETTKFVLTMETGIGPEHPMSGEKMSLATALYRAWDFDDAKVIARRLLNHQGTGHSIGLHTRLDERAVDLGLTLPACRVIVNQAHCFATGGSFDNGMPFSLSMGCGSWGGNSIGDNLHWRHFLNTSRIIRTIAPHEPSVEDVFASYWDDTGQRGG